MHDNEFLAKLREHERYLDQLMEDSQGEGPEREEEEPDIDEDSPAYQRMKRRMWGR